MLVVGSISVYAVSTIIDSKEVSYDNETSKGSYDNVQLSIDELYQRYKSLSGEQDTLYTEKILNGADPVLGDGMIPITLDGKGNAKYANLYTPWYKYEEKRWANAVILVKSPSKSYKTGDTILEKDIESYFVWIPRYSYKIWDLGNYDGYQENYVNAQNEINSIYQIKGKKQIIDVMFENKNTSPSTTQEVGLYYTHPAFIAFDVNGLWVGKFEIGGNENNIVVKPNVTSWRSVTVGTFWNTMFNYKRNLDSHMIKNTEWGAVAYLSHSIYGIANEVNINNNENYITGYSAATNTNQGSYKGESGTTLDKTQPYNTLTGYLASTTGNITGIYDMSGGTSEYVAGYVENYGIRNYIGIESGLTESDLAKTQYFDKYASDSEIDSYSKRILGDCTGEVGPFYKYYERQGWDFNHNAWYFDTAYFADASYPWFLRSDRYDDGVLASQFYFERATGAADGGNYGDIGSRLILAVK